VSNESGIVEYTNMKTGNLIGVRSLSFRASSQGTLSLSAFWGTVGENILHLYPIFTFSCQFYVNLLTNLLCWSKIHKKRCPFQLARLCNRGRYSSKWVILPVESSLTIRTQKLTQWISRNQIVTFDILHVWLTHTIVQPNFSTGVMYISPEVYYQSRILIE